MNESKELKTYTCQFCKQSYQSDGERKPKSFKKTALSINTTTLPYFVVKSVVKNL